MVKRKSVVRKPRSRVTVRENGQDLQEEKEIDETALHTGLNLIANRFNYEATRDHVLEVGVLQFDRKPVIIRPWSRDLNAMKLYGTLVEQIIDYEWLPVKCKSCSGYGHIMADYRKMIPKAKWTKTEGVKTKTEDAKLKDADKQSKVFTKETIDNHVEEKCEQEDAEPVDDNQRKDWITFQGG
uniref:Uncharacterized protein n=1 Tax=Cannabis sativa TaxID=3483 RepID=A0A803Q8M1_CANSA